VLALAASAAATSRVRFRHGVAVPDGDRVVVDGHALAADLVVWAVGTALPELFPGVTPVRPVRLDSWYVAAPGAGSAVARGSGPGPGPAWLDRVHDAYGIPGTGTGTDEIKIIVDTESTPGSGITGPPDDLARAVRRYIATRLPALAGTPLLRREPCWYATTPDEHFLLAPHPAHSTVWLLGGDSGHGFKHGPAWGAYVSDVLEGRAAPEPRLGLVRRRGSASA